MDLTVKIKGYEGAYDCGYITYGNFIMRLIKEAYGDVCYEMFRRSLFSGKPFTDLDEIEWAKHQNDDLELWIWHPDCYGKFTPQDINRIAMYGIIPSTTTVKCSKIYPNDAELRAVLYAMKSRCETRLGDLEKEFEAL